MTPPPRLDPTCLADHVRQCARACGSWHRLRCGIEALDGFIAPRFVTTLLLILLLVVGLLWSA